MKLIPCFRLVLAIVLAASVFVLCPASALASPEVAKIHYERALAFLESDSLEEARTEFELAYEASPHPDVLYNIGMVCLELEDYPAASQYFERFLKETAEGEGSQEKREQASSLLLSMPEQAPQKGPPAADAPIPPPGDGANEDATLEAAGSAVLKARESSSGTSSLELGPRTLPEQRDEGAPSHRRSVWRAVGLTFSAVGAGLVAASAGIFVWNQARAGRAKSDREALEQTAPSQDLAQGDAEGVTQAIEYEVARARNDETFDSIRQMDVVAGVTGIAGGLFIGTGVTLFIFHRRPVKMEIAPARVRLRMEL